MGKRLTESFKLQMIATRKKAKKAKQEKQRPTYKNLDISYDKSDGKDVKVAVTDIIDIASRETITSATLVDPTGTTFIIKSIECPICHKDAPFNLRWNAYICPKNEVHAKKIFEITHAVKS